MTITQEVLGQDVAAFLDGNDGGRDGAWTGPWQLGAVGGIDGNFVIQCKHFSRAGHSLVQSDVKDEVVKAERLVKKGLCDNYLLLTNATVSGNASARLVALFEAVGVRHFAVYGYDWICTTIQKSQALRMLVPRIYGLGDLSQILDERVYAQAKILLESLQDDLSKVVLTASYQKAARALDKHGFVLVIGEPAAGKTTIAAQLTLAAIDRWGTVAAKVDGAREVLKHWNPHEQSVLLWIDDAFGVTQYEPGLAMAWNRAFLELKAAINRNLRIIMTSRDYIYRAARRDLKLSAFPLLEEAAVVADVGAVTREERRQILYNHLRLGTQPRSFLTAAKPHLEAVAESARFIPEVARRLGDPVFTKHVDPTRQDLLEFVEKPVAFLLDVLKGLDADSRAALALVFMSGGMLPIPLELTDTQRQAIERLHSSAGGVIDAVTALSGSLLQRVTRDGVCGWVFKHPTIADAFARLVGENIEFIDIYLVGAELTRLLREVTCGVIVRGSSVEVPRSRYPTVLQRLIAANRPTHRHYLYPFLARRCGRDFLRGFIAAVPGMLDDVAKPGLFLDAVPEVPLALTLVRYELLPAKHLNRFRESLIAYTVAGEDVSLLTNAELQELFAPEELNVIVSRVRAELIPRLESVIRDQLSGYSPSETCEDREAIAAPYLDAVKTLQRQFDGDAEALSFLDDADGAITYWIHDAGDGEAVATHAALALETSPGVPLPDTKRSIFDDVDGPTGQRVPLVSP